jgi:diguanylate cyclase (GGDEF)-like protein/PAS domain S-box-containing protein
MKRMGEKGNGAGPRLSRAVLDLIIVGIVTLAALTAFYVLNVYGRIDLLVQEIGLRGLHDVFITSVILVVALAIYSLRRWKELSAEIRKRLEVEDELQRHQENLEETVEKRTSALRKVNEELESEIAERRQAEGAVHKSEKFLSTVFHSIRDPMSIIDEEFRLVRVNDAYAQMSGMPPEKLLGAKCHEILRERDAVCDDCVVEKTFSSGDPCAKEKADPTHEEMWIEIFTYPISGDNGKVSHVIEYIRDITGRKKSDDESMQLIKKLEHMSRTDSLTGLLNRRAIINELSNEVERARRYGSELSMLLCDIDRFKDTNDAYGHEAGDQALLVVSETLSELARKNDMMGRYGGDEFMLVLPDTGVDGAVEFARRITSRMEDTEVKTVEGDAFKVTLSVGITGFKHDKDEADILIRRADVGMYSSKRRGRNKITVEN